MEEIRIGMVGAGGMGNHHARQVADRDDVRVAALCDTSIDALDRLASTLDNAAGLGRYAALETMLAQEQLDAALIAQDCLSIFSPGATWRGDPELSGGGHFMDTGSHINDILLWTTWLVPERVQAFINQEGTLVDVLTAVNVEFTNGAVGNMAYTCLSPEWREEFRFYGTEGVVRFGQKEHLLLHRRGEDIILPRSAAGGKPPLHNFIEAVRGEAEVQAPAICGLRVAQLTEAAYASAQSGKPEPVG